MSSTITLPVWAFVLILLFAGVTFASHFLFPSVRWVLRRRAERLVSRLNTRLARPIEPFKLARRYDMIQRLTYDSEVIEAVLEHARKSDLREDVAFEQARRIAREIVPAFSATAYFGIGTRLARWLARSLYRVQVMQDPREVVQGLPPDATVIFAMNHRSNMDYVLVTYLVSDQTTLSYAVGEWARVWPLSAIFRAMGAYFIRRQSRGALYRRILARYVQLATEGGVTQAIFPEGGLSLDGASAAPRLGILSYLSEGAAADRVVYVPVGLAYDRVIEDRVLVRAAEAGERRFGVPILKAVGAVLRHSWLRLTRRFRGFGEVGVSFGAPLRPDPELRADVTRLGEVLMRRIDAARPALAVPLVARAVSDGARGEDIAAAVAARLAALDAAGHPRTPGTAEEITRRGLTRLAERGIVAADGTPAEGGAGLVAFYAASLPDPEAPAAPPPSAAPARSLAASAKQ